MDAKEKVLATMKEAGQPLNAGKIAELSGLDRKEVDAAMKLCPTGGTQRVSEILLFMLLTFFLAYTQTTEAKGQSPCFSYGASIMNGDLYCGHQEDSAFAMHSVMKFPQALYVADYLHKKGLTLSDSVLVHKDSLDAETWSPMLSIFEGMRYFTFAELIECH